MSAGRWGLVRVAGGAPVLAWLDGSRWRGWLVPWLPDESLEEIGRVYFAEEADRAPWQSQSGEWEFKNDADEVVRIDRHRKPVQVRGARGHVPLSDAGNMAWCWEEAEDAPKAALDAALDRLGSFVPARGRGRKA